MSDRPLEFEPERYEFAELPRYRFEMTRRAFVQSFGVGLLITAYAPGVFAQGRSASSRPISARFQFSTDGTVTAYTGKVEVGQGARTEISQAVAEELRVPLDRVALVMADTDLVPDDGGTYGSLTTSRTVPTVREAGAAARDMLIDLAANAWDAKAGDVTMQDGAFAHADGRRITLAKLVANQSDLSETLDKADRDGAAVRSIDAWTVLGTSTPRSDAVGIVTGSHQYPSDIRRPGMQFGAVLRPPSYGADLQSVDLSAATAVDGAKPVRDGNFVGCVAPTYRQARQAVERLAATATWSMAPHPPSDMLSDYLRQNANDGSGRSRSRSREEGDVDAALAGAARVLRATYEIPYIQHAPMETRAAAAEWAGGRLTVWTATQRPFDVQRDLARSFGISPDSVRLIVPDSGGGFGGKHQPDAAEEAARLAKAAGVPVSLQWTREEEFTWAYFRPAGVIDIVAGLDANGKTTAWDFTNYNSGGSALECPYAFANVRTRFQNTDSPLRQGSYRALAATANNFAREAFIDRLAAEAGEDPLAFRLARLTEPRMKAVLEAAADRMGVRDFRIAPGENVGIGIACGTEKGSYVATCAEVFADRSRGVIDVRRLTVAYDCGPALNPLNLRSQIEGGVIMGLGGALTEAIDFRDGAVLNPRFKDYEVPRFEDTPPIDVVTVQPDGVDPVGAGETPIIAVAPAIANAVRVATGADLAALPLRRAFA